MFRSSALRSVACLVALLFFTPFASAEIIVAWDTAGKAGNEASLPATTVATNISGLNITRGAGLGPIAGAGSFNSNNWDDGTADEFVQLGFTVTAGEPWFVETIRMGTRSSATGPGFINVLASVDGGAFFLVDTLVQPNGSFINPIVDINETVATSLLLRFVRANNVAADGGTIGGSGTWRIGDFLNAETGQFEDIIISGVLTPEPVSLVLFGVGLVGVVAVSRTRGRKQQRV